MAVDLTKLQFYSGNNYLKRSSFFGQMNAVSTGYDPNQTSITHNLGYIPQFIVAADYQNNGIWWANEFCNDVRGPGGATNGVIMISPSIDSTRFFVIASASYDGSIFTATRPVKYGIYLDS